jgi:hypothetical protein
MLITHNFPAIGGIQTLHPYFPPKTNKSTSISKQVKDDLGDIVEKQPKHKLTTRLFQHKYVKSRTKKTWWKNMLVEHFYIE